MCALKKKSISALFFIQYNAILDDFYGYFQAKPLTSAAVNICRWPVILPHSGFTVITVRSPWFWRRFLIETFFEILQSLRYRLYSGACCQSTQSWWLFWCCVWPDLPRYKRPHVNLSLSIICHTTSVYLKQTATLHSHTHRTRIHSLRDNVKGCGWQQCSLAILFRYACSHVLNCRYPGSNSTRFILVC